MRNSPCGRQRGGDAWHSSGEPPNLDSRLRGNDGCAKVSGGGNPSPDPVVRAIRSPRVAPMLQRRVSRGARRPPTRPTSPPVNLEPTPATPRPSSIPRRRESIPPDTIARSIRSPRVAPMLHRRVSRGARGPPTRHTSPPAASSRPVAVGPSIHPAQSGGALRANGFGAPTPFRRGTQGKRVCAAKAAGRSGRTGCVAPIRWGYSRPTADAHPSVNLDPTPATSRPSSFPRRRESIPVVVRHALLECTSSPRDPSPERTRSPRVAPMLQRRVSRGARASPPTSFLASDRSRWPRQSTFLASVRNPE